MTSLLSFLFLQYPFREPVFPTLPTRRLHCVAFLPGKLKAIRPDFCRLLRHLSVVTTFLIPPACQRLFLDPDLRGTETTGRLGGLAFFL